MINLKTKWTALAPESRNYFIHNGISHFIEDNYLEEASFFLREINFLQAKIDKGLLSGLAEEYALLKNAWQRTKENITEDPDNETIGKYVHQLIMFSKKPEKESFPLPPSSILKSLHWRKNKNQPHSAKELSEIDKVEAWENFITTRTRFLEQEAAPLSQLAYNSASGGPVSKAAQEEIESGKISYSPWCRLINRKPFQFTPRLHRECYEPESFTGSAEISPNGKFALCGYYSGKICLWDLSTGQVLHRFYGHENIVTSIAAAPDWKSAVSISKDGIIYLWDLEKRKKFYSLKGEKDTSSLSITADGSCIVTVADNKIFRWDLNKRQLIWGKKANCTSMAAISADGKIIISASDIEDNIYIWDALQGSLTDNIKYGYPVFSMSMTPDASKVILGGTDGAVRVLDITSRQIRTLKGIHESVWVKSIAITPDGQTGVSESHGGNLKLWDLRSLECVANIPGTGDVSSSVAVSMDGRCILSARDNGELKVWNTESILANPRKNHDWQILGNIGLDRFILQKGGHAIWVYNTELEGKFLYDKQAKQAASQPFVFTSDLEIGISGQPDNSICAWDLSEAKLIYTLSGGQSKVKSLHIVTERQLVIFETEKKEVHLLDFLKGEIFDAFKIDDSLDRLLRSAPDGRGALFADKNDNIIMIDLESKKSSLFKLNCGYIGDVVFSHDGKWMIVDTVKNFLIVWDMKELRQKYVYEKRNARYANIITPDNHYLITASGRNIITIDLKTGQQANEFCCHNGVVQSIQTTADGKYVVSSASDSTLKLWETYTGKCLATFTNEDGIFWPQLAEWPCVILGKKIGELSFVCFENVPKETMPLLTPRRMWKLGTNGNRGKWDEDLTVICYWCGRPIYIDEKHIGQEIKCPYESCKHSLHINRHICETHHWYDPETEIEL